MYVYDLYNIYGLDLLKSYASYYFEERLPYSYQHFLGHLGPYIVGSLVVFC